MASVAEEMPMPPKPRRPKRRAAQMASSAVKEACAASDDSGGENDVAADAAASADVDASSGGSNASDSSDLLASKRRRSRVARVRHKLRERKRSNTIRDSINDLRKLMALEDASVTALGRARPFRGVEGDDLATGGVSLDLDPAPLVGHWFVQYGVPLSQLVTRAPCRTRADVLERAASFAKETVVQSQLGVDIVQALIQMSITLEACVGGMTQYPSEYAVITTASGFPIIATTPLLRHLESFMPRKPDGARQTLELTKEGAPIIGHTPFDHLLPWFRRALQRLATKQVVPITVKVIPHGVSSARLWTGPAMVSPLPDLSDNINAFLVSFPALSATRK